MRLYYTGVNTYLNTYSHTVEVSRKRGENNKYSHLANRRGGTFIDFPKFFRPPRSLLGPPRLLIFKKKISDQDVFTIDLLYFQFFLGKNAYLTPI